MRFLFLLLITISGYANNRPNVIITTDINNAGGDPDDKQSLLHLLWYADQLNIIGIIPDAWESKGYEATMDDIKVYQTDYKKYKFGQKGFPHPDTITNRVMHNEGASIALIIRAAHQSRGPLYILAWGNLITVQKALDQDPSIVSKIRLLSIATGVKYGPQDEVLGEDCHAVNWNGKGRAEIYHDKRFDKLWWLENNWMYNGMFPGTEPKDMLERLTQYGAMGAYMKTIVAPFAWAQYFRAGDTPTVLYLLNNKWVGTYTQPFPAEKPNYYTDAAGSIAWNYADPCQTWQNAKPMYEHNKATLLEKRPEIYQALLAKLDRLYKK